MDFHIDKLDHGRMHSRAMVKETALVLMESCAEFIFYAGGRWIVRPLVSCFWAITVPKEGPMNKPTTYPWQTAYVFAFLELDPVKIPGKIDDAVGAIKERLRKPIELGSHEHRAIQDARAGIAMLRAGNASKPV